MERGEMERCAHKTMVRGAGGVRGGERRREKREKSRRKVLFWGIIILLQIGVLIPTQTFLLYEFLCYVSNLFCPSLAFLALWHWRAPITSFWREHIS